MTTSTTSAVTTLFPSPYFNTTSLSNVVSVTTVTSFVNNGSICFSTPTHSMRTANLSSNLADIFNFINSHNMCAKGVGAVLELPDDSKLFIEPNGSWKLEDKDAKTLIYKPNVVREFNTFVNASDRIEDFIGFCKKFNISQNELLELPLKLFIMWLIVSAAEADGIEEQTDTKKLQIEFKKRFRPRCKCGRFIKREKASQGFLFCDGEHYMKYAMKV